MKIVPLITILLTFSVLSLTGDAIPSSSASRKLKISELDYYVNTDEGRAILEEDFNGIKEGERKSWTRAVLPENLKKNRYNSLDVLPFDETRVVLENLPNDPYSDYINANYVNGEHSEKEYVAAQGPLPNTIDDFWRMIWQLNSTKIVMLTNLVEHGERKVEKYWPEETDKYGNITVTLISQHEFLKIHHVVRTFSVEKEGENTTRIIRHFHYTGWPDLSVPVDRLSVVALIQQTRKYKPDNKVPIVLHCSAGVGRTGTVILTDSMMQKAEAEGIVDFPAKLDHMRVQRVDVVEKKEQYIFAHQAVYDFFAGGDTDDYLRNVNEEYKIIDQSATDTESTEENSYRSPQG
nr:receptor-type tyrosine-protein phosphatase T [Parasteatoda tepidariorum]